LLHRQLRIQAEPRDLTTINNALIQSSLTDARALGWFFTRTSDINIAMFVRNWTDDVIAIAGEIVPPVSRHLSHATTGDKASERHPGEWPIREPAVVLTSGLARFFDALDPTSAVYERAWFTPSPRDTYDELMKLDPLTVRTKRSDNRSVCDLTIKLQQFVETHPH